jgi:hypothetical protein
VNWKLGKVDLRFVEKNLKRWERNPVAEALLHRGPVAEWEEVRKVSYQDIS